MNERVDGNISTADIAYGQSTDAPKTDPSEIKAEDTGEQEESQPLLRDTNTYNGRWQEIQGKFVDEPQASVREADSLVAEVIQKLAQQFADQRQQLEGQWSKGGEVSTEDLRQALRHYRSFFQRLLAA